MRLYPYVGPEEIRAASHGSPGGAPVLRPADLVSFSDGPWATYVVSAEGILLIAPRRSEHVACAGGAPVRAAGELCIGEGGRIDAISNLSTGYCPDVGCWSAVEQALDAAGIEHPGGFTYVAVFRRCPGCGERNLVKDDWFACSLCGSELPAAWNF